MSGSPLVSADSVSLAAQMKRWPGIVRIGDQNYDAAVVLGRGSDIIDAGGRMALASITARVPLAALPTAPIVGHRIIDQGTGQGFEIVSLRQSATAWTIRGAIFPR